MDNEFVTFTIGKKKHIALIAHDNEKPKLIEWCKENYDILKNHCLYRETYMVPRHRNTKGACGGDHQPASSPCTL